MKKDELRVLSSDCTIWTVGPLDPEMMRDLPRIYGPTGPPTSAADKSDIVWRRSILSRMWFAVMCGLRLTLWHLSIPKAEKMPRVASRFNYLLEADFIYVTKSSNPMVGIK